MPYDFDTPVNRRNSHSFKWDVEERDLPMWVADMDFHTAPEILSVLQARVDHGIFGYSIIPEEWYDAYQSWWKTQHGFSIEKEWLLFCTGIIPAISSTVRKLTTVGENVLLITPVYNVFYNSIQNNGRQVLECPMQYDGESYHLDFADLEQKLSLPQTTLLLLCNPHNPIGRIWDKETLRQIGALCYKYHVLVLADEIHCDLTDPGCAYTPFASVSEECKQNSITCLAPTKAFNLAGLQTAAVMVPNETLRHKVDRGLNTDEVAEPNVLAVPAAVAAFTQGKPWLDALREYLYENKQIVREYLIRELPELKLLPSEATYLLWLDCGNLYRKRQNRSSTETGTESLAQFLRRKTGLYLSEGAQYGGNGAEFLRMNIACPHATVQEGLHRLKQGLMSINEW